MRSKGDVSGSNRKPFKQKKTGRARQGDIRAPNLYHGGRAHGAKPRDYYFPLNKKVRLMGLKSMLTSKFIENNIIIVQSEKVNETKSNTLMRNLTFLKENRTLFVTSNSPCENFIKLAKNVPFIQPVSSVGLNVATLLDNKIVIFTKEGLNELVELLTFRKSLYYRNRRVPLEVELKKRALPTDKFKFDFDPSLPLDIRTPALKGSLESIYEYTNDPETYKQNILDQREAEMKEKEKLKLEKSQKSVDSLYSDSNLMDKRRKQLRKERRLKLMKEERKVSLKKKKQSDSASTASKDKKKK